MSWLSVALHAAARALTVPHSEREALNKQMQDNPALLAGVNALKDTLTTTLIHAAIGNQTDPLMAALEGIAIASQVERMIPTPPTPDPAAPTAPPADPGFSTAPIPLSLPPDEPAPDGG